MNYCSFPQHQQEDQQHQQYHYQYQYEQNHQPYDSTQYQPIPISVSVSDSSSQPRYSYSYSYSHNHQNQNDQQYPYYYHDYYYGQFRQQDPSILHPPGVPPPPQSSDPNSGFDPDVAVSQMTQFSENLPIGQTPYTGGRGGNRPFRGGRGRHGHHCPRSGGPAPSTFRGRGSGRGGGRHLRSQGAASSSGVPNPALERAIGEAAALVPQQLQTLPAASQVPAIPPQQPPCVAFCELCRVSCNSLEILEQHKNGKKHKKNLQVFERLQKLNKDNTEQQNPQMPNTGIKPDIVVQPENVPEGNQPLPENTSEVMTNNNSNVTEQQYAAVVVDASEARAENPERKQRDQFPARGRGGKRKMRGGGRGGKFIRVDEGSRVPTELPRHKQVVPLECELCNVKCDTQAVFNIHLSGKKHQSNLKRFQSNRGIHREAGMIASPSTSVAPQGINDPQVILAQLLMTYIRSQAPGSSNEAQNQRDSQGQGSDLTQQGQANQSVLTAEIRSQLQSLITMCNAAAPAWDTSNRAVNETSNVAVTTTSVHIPMDNTIVIPGESSGVSEQVPRTVSDQALSTQCKVVLTDPVVQPERAQE